MKINERQRDKLIEVRELLIENGGEFSLNFKKGSSPFICHILADVFGESRYVAPEDEDHRAIQTAISKALGYEGGDGATITSFIIDNYRRVGGTFSGHYLPGHEEFIYFQARRAWLDRILETGEIL